jgi:hypothetical protein
MAATGLIPVLILCTTMSWNEFQYKRFEKLYSKDQEKCFDASKRLVKRDAETSAPYYFGSMLYLKEANESKNERTVYSNLSRSLGLALDLNSKKEMPSAYESGWKEHLKTLDSMSSSCIQKMDTEKDASKIANLSKKRNKLGFVGIEVELEEELITEVDFVHKTGEFYGLPSGSEVIPAFDLIGEQEVLELINAERKKLGMGTLVMEESLVRASRYHSYDMATQDYFNHASHDRVNGKLVKVGKTFDRIKKFHTSSFVNSENIAAGNSGAKATYMQWFNSPGHYENMFNPESKKCGIAVFYSPESTYKYYWSFCTAL